MAPMIGARIKELRGKPLSQREPAEQAGVSVAVATAYAATLPAGQARGQARLVTTDMYRVETGNDVRVRRQPAEAAAQ